MLGVATDMGQTLLLPPGLHSWKSETIRFDRVHCLDDTPILEVGTYTIITVDDGYVAITKENGKQILLDGGQTHLLTHQKWRFERLMSLKMQSDDLQQVSVSTADGVLISIDAVMLWRIVIPQKAASSFVETNINSDISFETEIDKDMGSSGGLRIHVLKQALSCVAKFVGSMHYSGYSSYIQSFSRLSKDPNKDGVSERGDDESKVTQRDFSNPFFDEQGMSSEVETANNMIVEEFGAEIVRISIVSATPINKTT